LYHRSKRQIEPEAVFGHKKINYKFNRFTLRGKDKVEIEFRLYAITRILKKKAVFMSENIKSNQQDID
jgi:hypothetical protein